MKMMKISNSLTVALSFPALIVFADLVELTEAITRRKICLFVGAVL